MSTNLPDILVTNSDSPLSTHRQAANDSLFPTTGSKLLEPHSPTPTAFSSNDENSSIGPPSPTLSTSSVHFTRTSLALRDNKVDEHSGLSPDGAKHMRSGSVTSSHSTIAANEADNHLLHPAATSAAIAKGGRSNSRGSGDTHAESHTRGDPEKTEDSTGQERAKLDLDNDIDPTPFKSKPLALASLLDPKDFDALIQLGGVDGLLRGLGTHPTLGLRKKALSRSETYKTRQEAAAGSAEAGLSRGEKSDPNDGPPGIVVTSPAGDVASGGEKDPRGRHDFDEDGPAYTATLDRRRQVYGENILPQRRSKTLLQLMWLAFKDKVLILLSIAAVISLALGLFQDFGTPRPADSPPVEWVEGVAIMIAIFIVVIVGSLNDWQKERQFKKLNEKKDERGVKVIREGVEQVIDVKEVMVGDIALLEPGEIVPCDGIFLSGHNVKCDESGATGESDAIKKLSYNDCLALRDSRRVSEVGSAIGGDSRNKITQGDSSHTDCFIVSGSKVLEGVGLYVVVAVGQKSFNGRIMMALRVETENTPLQNKLNDLAELIAKIGGAAGLFLFIGLMIEFFVQLGRGVPQRTPAQKGLAFVDNLIIAVTVVVVAVPEGLPLAVTLALAFATKRMTKEMLLVRVLGSCETMANASVVCTDKTGTLTQNDMTVVAGSVGIHAKFVRELAENQMRSNADEQETPPGSEEGRGPAGTATGTRKHPLDFSLDQKNLDVVLGPQLRTLFNDAICINSTAFEDRDPETKELIFVGSKTETALLKFAKELGWPNWKIVRESAQIVQMIPFSSQRKAMGVVFKLPNGKHRLFLKGASEILTMKCTRHVVVRRDAAGGSTDTGEVETEAIDETATDNIQRTIIFYANQTLRTIALCYRDFPSWPPPGARFTSEDEVEYDDISKELTLIAITGIEDPLRPGVREAVAKCQRAGVAVKMCTGDNVLTARSIAIQCGIYSAGGIIMEGPVFRNLNDQQMLTVVPRLQVLARSSPEDKKILVEKLKELGEIVGVTGDGTNDGPALKTAHVGFSMGIAGTEVAKEASDIILMDDNFASIVKAIMWGRCVNDAVRKFLQFQVSTNVTAVLITIVTSLASNNKESVLTAVQLLWINIIMDTFAALALATDPASEELLNRKPDRKSAPLFNVDMYKQIMGQSIYQVTIILVFHFIGERVLGFPTTSTSKEAEHNRTVIKTLLFNAFVFAQIFNSVNCRRLDRKLNIFEGILSNYYFMAITLLEIGIQVMIVFVGGAAFHVAPISGRNWGISLALGFVSIPLGALIRLAPNGPFEKLFRFLRIMRKPDEVLPSTQPEWNPAIEKVRDGLRTFGNLRGGRLRSSSFVVKSRSAPVPKEPPARISALLTMIPTLVVSGVTTNWKQQGGSLSDPASTDPSKSTAALWEGKIEVHPDTKEDDPAFRLVKRVRTG